MLIGIAPVQERPPIVVRTRPTGTGRRTAGQRSRSGARQVTPFQGEPVQPRPGRRRGEPQQLPAAAAAVADRVLSAVVLEQRRGPDELQRPQAGMPSRWPGRRTRGTAASGRPRSRRRSARPGRATRTTGADLMSVCTLPRGRRRPPSPARSPTTAIANQTDAAISGFIRNSRRPEVNVTGPRRRRRWTASALPWPAAAGPLNGTRADFPATATSNSKPRPVAWAR